MNSTESRFGLVQAAHSLKLGAKDRTLEAPVRWRELQHSDYSSTVIAFPSLLVAEESTWALIDSRYRELFCRQSHLAQTASSQARKLAELH